MKELSLFTGMGGGIYGSLILGWETVAYVEREEYCQKVIKQRQLDGWFDKGEIYGDIAEFNKKHAQKYAGKIDVLTGGFPCQPFSVAGKRKGTSDERYLFDEIIKTIKIIQPRWLLFENVPGILSNNAIIEIYASLSKVGYRPKAPLVIGSADCGNIHKRERVWIFADSEKLGSRRRTSEECNDEGIECQQTEQERCSLRGETSGCSVSIADSKIKFSNGAEPKLTIDKEQQKSKFGNGAIKRCFYDTNTSKHRKQGSRSETLQREQGLSRRESIGSLEDILQRPDIPEPLFRRVDDELPDWSKQLKAIGNGQDPIVMATAWKILSEGTTPLEAC